MAHQDVKIEVAGDAQTAALFEEGVKQGVVIQNQIARFGIGQERDQGGRVVLLSQDGHDECDVIGRKLHATVRLNHVHKDMSSIIGSNLERDVAVSRFGWRFPIHNPNLNPEPDLHDGCTMGLD